MLLTMKDERKVAVLEGIMDRRLSVEEGGKVLGRSVRTIFRMLARLRTMGIRGLIHGNRGREGVRKMPRLVREKIVALAKGKYADMNDTHLQEILQERETIVVGRSTLRRVLRAAGIGPKRKRRAPRYRQRRERKEAFGLMLQLDASHHDWLQGRGPWLTLVGTIDDATSHVWARFEDTETTWAYFHLMDSVFSSRGLPVSLYSDRHTIFHAIKEPTLLEQLHNARPFTQFGRAMEELGIRIIKAWSPQAKGRIERLWGTFQDRLVAELKLAGARTKEEANDVLKTFLSAYNRKFTVKAHKQESFFRVPPPPTKLARILCLKETRVVNRDHTVSFEGLILQIPPSRKWASIAKQKVDILQLQDGAVEIVYKNLIVARFSKEAMTRLVANHQPERSQLKYAA